ncbi:MAG: metallophosphoesterase family protein [Gemmatimonadota bacterium]
MVVGVISDTHGLLRPEAIDALEGSELILHAGDVGDPEILRRLGEIAPVRCVRGNTDHGPFGASLPHTELVDLTGADGPWVYMVHDVDDLDIDPAGAGVSMVVYGHSHRPAADLRDGVLFFNPGAAGHRRFSLPVTVGRVTVRDGEIDAEILDLEARGPLR